MGCIGNKRGRLISNYEAVFILKLIINLLWWLDGDTLIASLFLAMKAKKRIKKPFFSGFPFSKVMCDG